MARGLRRLGQFDGGGTSSVMTPIHGGVAQFLLAPAAGVAGQKDWRVMDDIAGGLREYTSAVD